MMLVGHRKTGGVVSRLTVTLKEQALRLVHRSVAAQVTVVVPRGNTLPDGGTQTAVTFESQMSVAWRSN